MWWAGKESCASNTDKKGMCGGQERNYVQAIRIRKVCVVGRNGTCYSRKVKTKGKTS